jgi:hypothetical protein
MGKFVPFKKKGDVEAESDTTAIKARAVGGKKKGKKKRAKKVGRSSFASEIFGK